jgi:hypothetical protein
MARSADHAGKPQTAHSGQPPPAQDQRVPAPEGAVVLTPAGQRRLTARATWLATERISRLASNLGDPGQDGWAGEEYRRAVTELARLTSILGQAMTTLSCRPSTPRSSSSAARSSSSSTPATPSGFWWSIEAPFDDLRISVESPLAQAQVGRRVGKQVRRRPPGRYRCRILATGRHQTTAASWPRTSSWVTEGGMGYVRPLPAWDGPLGG